MGFGVEGAGAEGAAAAGFSAPAFPAVGAAATGGVAGDSELAPGVGTALSTVGLTSPSGGGGAGDLVSSAMSFGLAL